MLSGVVLAVMAAILFAFGRWGWVHASALVPAWMPEEHQSRRIAVIRRGAVASTVVGVLVTAAAVAACLA